MYSLKQLGLGYQKKAMAEMHYKTLRIYESIGYLKKRNGKPGFIKTCQPINVEEIMKYHIFSALSCPQRPCYK